MFRRPHRSVPFSLLVLVASFASCGRSAPATATAGPAADATVGAAVAAVEERLLELVNGERRRAEVGELAAHGELARVARRHSRHMRDAGFFGHEAPDGTGLVERVRRAGVEYRLVAENVARVEGYPEPARALHRTLMDSRRHRKNLLNGRFTRVGIGVARQGDRWWLTQVFLRPPGGAKKNGD